MHAAARLRVANAVGAVGSADPVSARQARQNSASAPAMANSLVGSRWQRPESKHIGNEMALAPLDGKRPV